MQKRTEDKTPKTPPTDPAPVCDNNSNKTAGDLVVKVPVLPPLQPDITSQDRYLRDLFGVDNDNKDKVPKVPQTLTVGGAANYHTLVRNQL